MKNEKTSKRAVALGLTAGLVGGGAAGLVLGVPGLTGAAGADPAGIVVSQTDTDTGSDSGTDTDEQTDGGKGERPEPGERMREALQSLVDDGTISGDQADAVAIMPVGVHLDAAQLQQLRHALDLLTEDVAADMIGMVVGAEGAGSGHR